MASGVRRAIAAVLLLSGAGVVHAGPVPTVRTEGGALVGVSDAEVVSFKGIPYAAPPVGSLRWRPPAPVVPWSGTRQADRFGAACPQEGVHKEAWARVGAQSEDCLFLNVWRPAGAGAHPVMVFVHGGGFTYGSAGVPLYDGAALAGRGVVVVTLNYRLGRLGFFAHPALTAEDPTGELGNYGVMDVVAALRWVQRNATAFGGDPADVTLFGESAGAGITQILMSSPQGAGLFAKAISESGAGLTALAPIRGGKSGAETAGRAWAEGLGLKDATPAQLRAVPLAEVIKGRGFPFVDGRVVAASPGQPFSEGAERALPLLIGSNTNEGSLLGNDVAAMAPVVAAAGSATLGEYRRLPGMDERRATIALAEDAALVLPSLAVADWHARRAPTYAYRFAQVPVDARTGSLGAEHGGEVAYLFGNRPEGERWDDGDRRVSKLMGDAWVRFAKTGDPNGAGLPSWPRVAGSPTALLVFQWEPSTTNLTPLEETVKSRAVAIAKLQWSMTPRP